MALGGQEFRVIERFFLVFKLAQFRQIDLSTLAVWQAEIDANQLPQVGRRRNVCEIQHTVIPAIGGGKDEDAPAAGPFGGGPLL
jgi:hypothetical protein